MHVQSEFKPFPKSNIKKKCQKQLHDFPVFPTFPNWYVQSPILNIPHIPRIEGMSIVLSLYMHKSYSPFHNSLSNFSVIACIWKGRYFYYIVYCVVMNCVIYDLVICRVIRLVGFAANLSLFWLLRPNSHCPIHIIVQ